MKRFNPWLEGSPLVVAESLIEVPDLIRAALDPGTPADKVLVASAIARSLLPKEASDPPPGWLRPEQVTSFRRLLAAVRSHGGAMLANPVGSGKTFVALAVASRLSRGSPIDVVAPAVLLDTWRESAARVGVAITLQSHERASRGEVPNGFAPVIIDESHRFRTQSTRRYRALAPALIRRPVILVTATPVVNRLDDLAHQLLLAVRDDALRYHGIASIAKSLTSDQPTTAFAAVVVAEPLPEKDVPGKRSRNVADWLSADPAQRSVLSALDKLRFSRHPGLAALLRTNFLRAFASSPAALLGMVRRYSLLLDHAAAARRVGRHVSRRDVEREVGALPEQLVMWELIDDPEAPAELALGDRRLLDHVLKGINRCFAEGDHKVAVLAATVADRRPSLVFTAWSDTVDYLRSRLASTGVAWINGARAGVGRVRCPRAVVLRAFDPSHVASLFPAGPPWLLLSTDVAAEGLNLHKVSRVVHYDLPWTQVRVDQRDGRAIRIGSKHETVSVVQFDPPPAVEARLLITSRLDRKGRLPTAVGLGREVTEQWAWHRRLRAEWAGQPEAPGHAVVESAQSGAVVAFVIETETGSAVPNVVAREANGPWSSDPALVEALLASVASSSPAQNLGLDAMGRVLDSVAPVVRQRVRIANGAGWLGTPTDSHAVGVLRRELLAAQRDRDTVRTRAIDGALGLVARGRSAGEDARLRAALGGDPAGWARLAPVLDPRSESTGPGVTGVRLIGVLVFENGNPEA